MEIVAIGVITESDGWLHYMALRNERGLLEILDDTDYVEIRTSDKGVATVEEAAKIWQQHGFGTSVYPVGVPDGVPRTTRMLEMKIRGILVWDGDSATLSGIAAGIR